VARNIKCLAVIITTLLALSSLTIVGVVCAQSVPKPSVPEFTIKYVDNSYKEPDTYTKNGYTGETVTHYGDYVKNETIEITIKNQPFVSTKLADGNYTQLWYGVRTKGHYEDWTPNVGQGPTPTVRASDTTYTVILISLQDSTTQAYGIGHGSVVDIQVNAFVGHPVTEYYPFSFDHILVVYEPLEKSEWSAIQTISIPESSASTYTPNPASNPSPTVPEFPVTIVIPFLFLIVLATAVPVVLRKKVFGQQSRGNANSATLK
jgi:hypothetical protein